MGKSSLTKVQYLHTSIAVLTAKYSSLGLSKLNFRFVENFFSPKWKNFFKPLKIFENKERFGLGRRSITLKTHFATPCQAKNKNRLLSKKRAPTPHRHRVSVENQLIHCTLQSTTDTLEKIRKTLSSSSILGQGLRHIVMSLLFPWLHPLRLYSQSQRTSFRVKLKLSWMSIFFEHKLP